MNLFSKPSPILAPEDLGIDLEEDSSDVTDDEVSLAVDTDDYDDLRSKVIDFVDSQAPTFQIRRKSGVLYSRVSAGEQSRLFNVEWIRKGNL
jgi:hypothetical protein